MRKSQATTEAVKILGAGAYAERTKHSYHIILNDVIWGDSDFSFTNALKFAKHNFELSEGTNGR